MAVSCPPVGDLDHLKPVLSRILGDSVVGLLRSPNFWASTFQSEVDARSFVDGAGSREVIPSVWERASRLLDGAFAVELDDVAEAIRLLAERARVIAEGAGALAVAAAVAGKAGGGKVVAIVSGGNIDTALFTQILGGRTP